jgi:hypothetical protein
MGVLLVRGDGLGNVLSGEHRGFDCGRAPVDVANGLFNFKDCFKYYIVRGHVGSVVG